MNSDPPPVPPDSCFRVQLVDDHHMMRVGLIALAQASGRLPITWLESGNLFDALEMHQQQPGIDLVLLDLHLPDSEGLQGLRRFLGQFPSARVAIFTATSDEFVVRQALGLGAVGFLPKSATAEGTLRLVESLLIGAASAEDTAPAALWPGGGPDAAALPEVSKIVPPHLQGGARMLTASQYKVLELILAGMSNQEIANECHLALGTVKNYVSAIFLAMDVQSRSQLISVFR